MEWCTDDTNIFKKGTKKIPKTTDQSEYYQNIYQLFTKIVTT